MESLKPSCRRQLPAVQEVLSRVERGGAGWGLEREGQGELPTGGPAASGQTHGAGVTPC